MSTTESQWLVVMPKCTNLKSMKEAVFYSPDISLDFFIFILTVVKQTILENFTKRKFRHFYPFS